MRNSVLISLGTACIYDLQYQLGRGSGCSFGWVTFLIFADFVSSRCVSDHIDVSAYFSDPTEPTENLNFPPDQIPFRKAWSAPPTQNQAAFQPPIFVQSPPVPKEGPIPLASPETLPPKKAPDREIPKVPPIESEPEPPDVPPTMLKLTVAPKVNETQTAAPKENVTVPEPLSPVKSSVTKPPEPQTLPPLLPIGLQQEIQALEKYSVVVQATDKFKVSLIPHEVICLF